MCPIMRKLALPRAMALSGAGACTIFSQARQENFGRIAGDLEDDGFDVERFVGVLRETAKSAAACRAHAIATRRQMHDFFTRQMRGQRSIWRLAFADGRCREQRHSASAVSSSSSASSSWAISLASFSKNGQNASASIARSEL